VHGVLEISRRRKERAALPAQPDKPEAQP
jgi:hypothetical protein